MLIVQVCVGSSCHLKGSYDIVELIQKAVDEYNIDDEVVLSGSFCIGKCNRIGVTVQVNDDVHVGVTKENFEEFLRKIYLTSLKRKGSDLHGKLLDAQKIQLQILFPLCQKVSRKGN